MPYNYIDADLCYTCYSTEIKLWAARKTSIIIIYVDGQLSFLPLQLF